MLYVKRVLPWLYVKNIFNSQFKQFPEYWVPLVTEFTCFLIIFLLNIYLFVKKNTFSSKSIFILHIYFLIHCQIISICILFVLTWKKRYPRYRHRLSKKKLYQSTNNLYYNWIAMTFPEHTIHLNLWEDRIHFPSFSEAALLIKKYQIFFQSKWQT